MPNIDGSTTDDSTPPQTGPLPTPTAIEAPIDPTGDSTGTDSATQSLNTGLLNGAQGDTDIWGAELSRFLVTLTGKTIDPASLSTILAAFGQQVQSQTYKMAGIAVANYPIESKGHTASALLGVMDFRSDAAAQLLGTVAE